MAATKKTPSKSPVKKPTNVKVGTGKAAKTPGDKKAWWKLGYLSMAAFLFVATLGYAGFSTYQGYQMKARADNWTSVGTSSTYHNRYGYAWACKSSVNTMFGNLWRVRVLVNRGATGATRAEMYALPAGGGNAHDVKQNWLNSPYGSYVILETWAGPSSQNAAILTTMFAGNTPLRFPTTNTAYIASC